MLLGFGCIETGLRLDSIGDHMRRVLSDEQVMNESSGREVSVAFGSSWFA